MKLKIGLLFSVLILIGGFFVYKMAQPEQTAFWVGKRLPQVHLTLLATQDTVSLQQVLPQEVTLLHVFTTWCGPCVHEHSYWVSLAKSEQLPMVAIAYRDEPEQVERFLNHKGNPYQAVLLDKEGFVGLDLGLRGTPETFLLDKKGVVRFHHVGALTEDEIKAELVPLIVKWRAQS